jgi:hypothetical protein
LESFDLAGNHFCPLDLGGQPERALVALHFFERHYQLSARPLLPPVDLVELHYFSNH